MSADILQFTPREKPSGLVEYCWQCGCGGQLFFLLENGDVVCRDCDHINTPLRVVRVQPELA